MEVAVLAGGPGKRLGGVYKPVVEVCGKPAVVLLAENLGEAASSFILVVHDSVQKRVLEDVLARYPVATRYRVLLDEVPVRAPLAGLYTALRNSRSEFLGVAPADTPFLRGSSLLKLRSLAEGYDGAVPVWPNGYVEPLIAVYRVPRALAAVASALSSGRLRVMDALGKLNVRFIPIGEVFADPERETFNLNRPEDYEKARKLCGSV